MAIMDFTGGLPEIVGWDGVKDPNYNEIWSKILASTARGALQAAASTHGKRSKKGIVNGHAYSVHRAEEIDGKKMLLLRNTWARQEWNGDWSDKSSKWDERMRNLCNHGPAKDDGLFWMEFKDFVEEFGTFYIVDIWFLGEGWHETVISGEWTGKYAAGL